MADAFPFVQVNIPQGNVMPGTEAGGRSVSGEAAEPGLFDSLVAEFASAQENGVQDSLASSVQSTPVVEPLEQDQNATLQPPVLLAESMLSLVASIKGEPDKTEKDPQPIQKPEVDAEAVDALLQKIESLMDKGLLSQERGEKLASLLTKLKTVKPEELPFLREEALQVAEELSSELEPEAAEELKQQLMALFPSQQEKETQGESVHMPVAADVNEKTEKPVSAAKKLLSMEKTKAANPDEEPEEKRATEEAPELSQEALAAMSQTDSQNIRKIENEINPQEERLGPAAEQEAVQEPAQMAERNSLKRGTPQPASEAKPQSRPDLAGETMAAVAASQTQSRGPTALRREENQEAASVAQPVSEERQLDTSRGSDGNTGSMGSQGDARGQQTQAGIRRAVGNVSAAGEDEAAAGRTERAETTRGISFQSFFEGVLSSRRTGATPAPMSLTPNTPNAAYVPRAEVLRDGVVNVVRFARADGVRRANVIVDPPALGRISVELTTSTSGVEASIRVSSEQVRQLVQDQISQLRMTLEQQGVQVTQFAVDVQQDNGERQQGQGQGGREEERRRRNRVGAIEGTEEAEDEFRVDLEEGMLHWVA